MWLFFISLRPMNHEMYMLRCIELAVLGLGNVAPNPMVGSVIVHNDKIIGEGYHKKFGEPHAEVNAINAVSAENKKLLPESTIYVSLEPCSHFGKTPPCADLIIANKIPRVVIGGKDPNPQVSGKGIHKLREVGIEVIENVLEEKAAEVNKRFITYHRKHRPYIILKWAQTIDGMFSEANDKQTWISNHLSQELVHKWRSEEQAVMVGTQTALIDNPQLNVRMWQGRNPVRIVIDRDLKLPDDLHIFDKHQRTIVFTEKNAPANSKLEYKHIGFNDDPLNEMMQHLFVNQIISVMVEGGEKLISSLLSENLWDEARVIIGNKIFGEGVKAPAMPKNLVTDDMVADDRLLVFRNS